MKDKVRKNYHAILDLVVGIIQYILKTTVMIRTNTLILRIFRVALGTNTGTLGAKIAMSRVVMKTITVLQGTNAVYFWTIKVILWTPLVILGGHKVTLRKKS